jgi:hypothetical protein
METRNFVKKEWRCGHGKTDWRFGSDDEGISKKGYTKGNGMIKIR